MLGALQTYRTLLSGVAVNETCLPDIRAMLRRLEDLKKKVLDRQDLAEQALVLKAAMDYQGASLSSHVYFCPNNHPYVIGNCGGAMQVSRCPECGKPVGGSSHQLLGGNRRADELLQQLENLPSSSRTR